MTAIYISAIDGMTNFTAADVTGVETAFLADEGVIFEDTTDYLVAAQGSPNMSVQVAKGTCYVKRDAHVTSDGSQKYWQVVMDGVTNVTITTADPSNPRIDIICVKIDTGASPNADADNVGSVVAVAGTPAGSPSRPAIPNNYVEIGQVAVGAGVTTITNSNITDTRVIANLKQTLIPTPQGPQGYMRNGKIVTSIVSNDLVVAIKTIAGNDPSPSDPVYVRIGNTERKLVAALSLTLADGTNWMNAGSSELATYEIDYFTYLGWDATNSLIRLCISRISRGRIYSDFSATSTNETYLAKSGTLNSTDEVEVVGRFNAILGVSATYLWTIPATSIVISRPIYETRWLSWEPTYGATAPMTYADAGVTTERARYQVQREGVLYDISAYPGTTGGSASASVTCTLPLTPLEVTGTRILGQGTVFDPAGSDVQGYAYQSALTAAILIFKYNSAVWGIGATRGFSVQGRFRI